MFILRILRRITLFAVGFTTPLSAFKVLDFGVVATPFKLTTAMLLVLAALEFALKGRPRRRNPNAVWILLFLVVYGISNVMSVVKGYPIDRLIFESSTIVSLAAFYFLLNYVVESREDLVILLWSLAAGAAITAVPAGLGFEEAEKVTHAGARHRGLSGGVNVLGFDMVICLPIVVALFIATKSAMRRLVLIGAGTLIAGGLLLSLSRTAFVSAAGVWALWVYRSGRIDTLKYAFPALAVVVATILLAPESVSKRIETMTDPAQRAQDESIQSRFEQWRMSAVAIASSPIIGVGNSYFMRWSQESPDVPASHGTVHNAYLRIGAEQGLLGLTLYLGILWTAWRQYSSTWRLARTRRNRGDRYLSELGHYALFLQLALFGSMIGGVFAHAQKYKTAWMAIALGTAVWQLARARVGELERESSSQEVTDTYWANQSGLSGAGVRRLGQQS